VKKSNKFKKLSAYAAAFLRRQNGSVLPVLNKTEAERAHVRGLIYRPPGGAC